MGSKKGYCHNIQGQNCNWHLPGKEKTVPYMKCQVLQPQRPFTRSHQVALYLACTYFPNSPTYFQPFDWVPVKPFFHKPNPLLHRRHCTPISLLQRSALSAFSKSKPCPVRMPTPTISTQTNRTAAPNYLWLAMLSWNSHLQKSKTKRNPLLLPFFFFICLILLLLWFLSLF